MRDALRFITFMILFGAIAAGAESSAQDSAAGLGSEGEGAIKLLYFDKVSCPLCRKVRPLLKAFGKRYPEAEMRWMDIHTEKALKLNEILCKRTFVPKDRWGIAPSVFSVDRGLVGDSITSGRLDKLAQSARGLEAPWELDAASWLEDADFTAARYGELTPLMVTLGGLVDGINPCAFAVIVFFVTYMAYVGKSRSEVALAGALFTGAVFVTYLAIGLGLYSLLGLSGELSESLQRVLYAVMAILLALAAALSLLDGVRCMRGRPEDVILKLPERLKSKIKLLVTRRVRLGLTLVATPLLGGAVALLEFPCTGQVYTPIVLMLRRLSPESWGALGWLLVYNVCFILPLLAVFLGMFFGVKSERLAALFQRHMAKAKFALAGVFLGLLVLLVALMP